MTERGAMLPLLAALVFVALVVVALAGDVALYAATYREAAFAADVGAEAGAAVISERAAYGGRLLLDPPAAEAVAIAAARAARPRVDRSVDAVATDTEVCVTVVEPFRPRFLLGVVAGDATVRTAACAVPRRG